MKMRCGIDLGTTYSAISWYDDVSARIEHIALDSQDGEELMQSVVYFEPGGNVVVGEAAAHAACEHPDRAFAGFKQAMGTDWSSPAVDGKQYTAPDLSAIIIERLVRDAEVYLGSTVDEVVVTVPAYFGHQEREDTRKAAELAGLNLIELLSEPHAAALAFAVDRIDDIRNKALVVFHLGGGTFDVVLMRGQVIDSDDVIRLDAEIVHKEGDRELGGINWDFELCDLVAEKVLAEHGHDPRDDIAEAAVMRVNVEQAKRKLSTTSSWTVAPGSQAHTVTVTREEFEEETSGLLAQTAAMLQKVLDHLEGLRQEAGDDPDPALLPENLEVLLCGGSTRMPAVREMIEQKIGKPPLMQRNPDLVVSAGAAYRAFSLGKEQDQMGSLAFLHDEAPDGSGGLTTAAEARATSGSTATKAPIGVRSGSDRGVAAQADTDVMYKPEFSAFHPREVLPEEINRLAVYVHSQEMQSKVIGEAADEFGADVQGGHDHARRPISRAAELLLVPHADGIVFNPRGQSIGLWSDMQRVTFGFRAQPEYAGLACSGGVLFLLEGIIIGYVPLCILVRSAVDSGFEEELSKAVAQSYSDIFVSYSHKDTRAVLRCEHYARSLGNRFIRDQQDLRTGDQWSPRLLEMIDDADVFQLFWSPSAARSEYVKMEWQHALEHETQSAGFIRPVYWRKRFFWFPEAPFPGPPPHLKHIHFTYVQI